jgi:hypothetical protein
VIKIQCTVLLQAPNNALLKVHGVNNTAYGMKHTDETLKLLAVRGRARIAEGFKPAAKKLIFKNVVSAEILQFGTIREAALFFGACNKTLNSCIKTDILFRGEWSVTRAACRHIGL